MWNFLVGVLLTDASIVLYDGNPGVPGSRRRCGISPTQPGMTCFGTSAAFIAACMKSGRRARAPGAICARCGPSARPARRSRRRASAGSTTSSAPTRGCSRPPAAPTCAPRSSAACRRCRSTLGELQARALGASVEAWDEEGQPLIDEVGELVITKPMPSMPIYFWGDEAGERYRESYFSMFPGVWRHGDWIEITPRGTRDHLRPLGLDDQPRRRADGHERDLPRGAVARRGARRAGGRRAARRAPMAGCRCSSCSATAPCSTTTLIARDPPAAARGLLAAPRARRDPRRSTRCRGRCRARCSRCRSSGS